MLKPHSFTNIGTRNKGSMWEYISALAYRNLRLPGSKFGISKFLAYGEGRANQHCWNKEEMVAMTGLVVEEINAKVYTEDFFEMMRQYYIKPSLDLEKNAVNIKASSLSNEELMRIYGLFCEAAAHTYPPMLLGFWGAYLDKFFIGQLDEEVKLDQKEKILVISDLLTIPKMSFAEKEREEILKIVDLVKLNGMGEGEIAREASQLADRFGWFYMEYEGEPFYKEHYVEVINRELNSDVVTRKPSELKLEIIKKQQGFFHKHPSSRLKDLTRIMQEMAFILDESKVYTVFSHHLVFATLKEIEKRLGIENKDIYLLVRPEIENVLRGRKLDKRIIVERKKYRAVFLNEGKIEILAGFNAKKLAEELIEVEENKLDGEIRGLVAYPGFYKGVVCIVSSPADEHKFKEGAVVVTHDGTAELTHFLQRAGAVVCDQGGIISHAAIVARESKIPTILSTKIGTKLLKDGDFVEVDAEKGVVRKIDDK